MICQYCGHKLQSTTTGDVCTNPICPGKLRGTPPSKEPKVRELENAYIEQGAILEWIQMILDGKEVSEFALSYTIVRQVWDLKQEASHD